VTITAVAALAFSSFWIGSPLPAIVSGAGGGAGSRL